MAASGNLALHPAGAFQHPDEALSGAAPRMKRPAGRGYTPAIVQAASFRRMTTTHATQTQPDATTATTPERVGAVLTRLLPLAAGVASGLRWVTLLGVAAVLWLFAWMFWLKGFGPVSSAVVTGLAALPVLVLLRFWLAVEDLRNLPEQFRDMGSGLRREMQDAVRGLASGDRAKALNILGQARRLFEIRSLLGQLSEVAGHYVSIGTLVNPLSLLLGVVSLLLVGVLLLVGIVLGIVAAF